LQQNVERYLIMENFAGNLKLKKYEDYINVFDALSHPVRIKIIGILAEGRQYVSELARLVNISRPLLYMHLKKLETARLVTSEMEISESGKAMKYYALEDFELKITKELLNGLSQNIIIESPSKGSD
jgi:ArsR family transcriptional regulator